VLLNRDINEEREGMYKTAKGIIKNGKLILMESPEEIEKQTADLTYA